MRKFIQPMAAHSVESVYIMIKEQSHIYADETL